MWTAGFCKTAQKYTKTLLDKIRVKVFTYYVLNTNTSQNSYDVLSKLYLSNICEIQNTENIFFEIKHIKILFINYFENFKTWTSQTSITNCFLLQYVVPELTPKFVLILHHFISSVTLLEYFCIACLLYS